MKKAVIILLVLTMILSLAACGGNAQAPAGSAANQTPESAGSAAAPSNAATPAEPKKEMTVAIAIDAGSLNPYDRLENIGRQTWISVYESLFEYGQGDLVPKPVLVDTYEFSEDQKTLTLNLKQGVLFHNGQEMKAEDVVFSFDILRVKKPSHMGDVDWDGIHAEGDYTVVIPFNSVQGNALYYICNLYVLCKSYMESIPDTEWSSNCIGTGPYMWGECVPGSEYELLRFDGYREKKALDKITIRVIPDADVQKIELETGGVDMACSLSFADAAAFAEDPNDGVNVTPSNQIAILELVNLFPDPNSPLADLRVREAILYALDLETINKVVYSGLGEAATAIYPSGVTAYKKADNLRTYNVEKAKELLAEAGYPNGLTLDLYAQNTTVFQTLADVLVGMGSQAGINFNVISCDFATLEGYMNSGENSGVYTYRQYANGDPYILVNQFFWPEGATVKAYKQYTDEKFQECVDARAEAMVLIDQAARNEAYHKLMQVAYDRLYYAPVVEYADQVAHSEAVKGFWMSGPIYHYEDCYFE